MDSSLLLQSLKDAFASTTYFEWLGFLMALLYSLLAALEKPLCWLFAFISSILYFYICVENSLYLQALLQVFYVAMSVYGWWSWREQNGNKSENENGNENEKVSEEGLRQGFDELNLKAQGPKEKEKSGVVRWSLRELSMYMFSGLIVALITGYLFANYTETHLPWLDASITVFSFLATWMMTRKILQNWLMWIFIDTATVYLYATQSLSLSALLYIIYTLIAIYGYLQWRKKS